MRRAAAPGAVSPDQRRDAHRLVRRCEPAADVIRRADDFTRQIETIARYVEVVVALGNVLVLGFSGLAGPEVGIPDEGVGIGVAGDFDVRQPEHLSGDGFQPRAELGVQAVRRDFGLDHRDRGRRAVFFEDLPQQDFRGRRTARQLGEGREAVAIDMGEEKAAAVFGGDVGNGNFRQA